jgi:hypothetical protein
MKTWFTAVVLILLSGTASGQALIDRAERAEQAGEQWLNTHFFENGRGMTLSPDLAIFFGGLEKQPSLIQDPYITKKFGFLPGTKQRYVGVFGVEYKGMELAVLGCTGCHSGRAAGQLIPGLGNKTIDPFTIGRTVKKAQNVWQHFIADKLHSDPDWAYVHDKAMNFANVLADDRISNLTRGLVPDSVIKTFFYRDTNTPYGAEIGRTQVKVPSLWGFAEKRRVGVFADGSLNSQNYAWAFGAELMASDSGEHLRASLPKLKQVVDNVIGRLLPPKYPFNIDRDLAEQGRPLVEKNCFECHGQHKRDPEGFPIFEPPQLIPHDLVGTNDQRLDYGNSVWVDLAEQGSLSDLIKFNRHFFNFGYYAPKLWGIWSRFPYFHNGSVPTLYHVLSPPEERPKVFSMEDAGELYRFDKNYVGLRTYRNPAMITTQILKAKRGNRNLYWIGKEEHGNQGHYYDFMEDWTQEDKLAVIEYLKTL